MLLEHLVLYRVVLPDPLHKHGSVFLFLIHVVFEEVLQGVVSELVDSEFWGGHDEVRLAG